MIDIQKIDQWVNDYPLSMENSELKIDVNKQT